MNLNAKIFCGIMLDGGGGERGFGGGEFRGTAIGDRNSGLAGSASSRSTSESRLEASGSCPLLISASGGWVILDDNTFLKPRATALTIGMAIEYGNESR